MEALSEVRGSSVPMYHSLDRMIRQGTNSNPQATAVTCLQQPVDHLENIRLGLNGHHDFLAWNFEQLEAASLTVARSLRHHGAHRGTFLFSLLPNGIESIIMQWVATLLQLTYVPLDPEVLCLARIEQTQFYFASLGEVGRTGAIVVPDRERALIIDGLPNIENGGTLKLVAAGDASGSWIPLNQMKVDAYLAMDIIQDDETEEDLDRTAAVLFTSGTSQGRPKGCPLTVRNIMAARANDWAMAEMSPSWLVTFLSFRIIFVGLTYLCGATGRELIIPAGRPSPSNILAAIERLSEKQLTMITVPNLVRIFANGPAAKTSDLTSIKRLMFGGDIANEENFGLAQKVFPAAKISTVMGMTEAGGVIGFAGGHAFLPTRYHQGISSIGKPGNGAGVRIVDNENRPVRRGQTGRLLISGSAVLQRYLGDAHPELFSTDEAGKWLDTGDVAVMDEAEGEIFIVGRTKDIIKRGGVSLSPAVLENVLQMHCAMDVAVVALPDKLHGEVPVVIVNGPAPDIEHMKKVAPECLGREYEIGRVVRLADLGYSEWPLNATGKIQKLLLKAKLAS